MKSFPVKRPYALVAGLALTVPAAFFISISMLKYSFRVPFLFDVSYPLLQKAGINEPPGLNINSLIVFGPILACLVNLISILSMRFKFTDSQIDCHISISKSWGNLAVIVAGSTTMLMLCAYMAVENCR